MRRCDLQPDTPLLYGSTTPDSGLEEETLPPRNEGVGPESRRRMHSEVTEAGLFAVDLLQKQQIKGWR
jgi:hypothetical protein